MHNVFRRRKCDMNNFPFVTCQIGVFFNVEAEVEEPTFEVTVNLLQDTLNLLEIETCARPVSVPLKLSESF